MTQSTSAVLPKGVALGALRAATLVCPDLDIALRGYAEGLGFETIERGTIPLALAESWGAPGHAGDRYAVMSTGKGSPNFLRFVENERAGPHQPFETLGWNAIEISVESSEASVASLSRGPFEIVGPAQILEFSEGALAAGQLIGPCGETVYLTQVNRQIEDFTLPRAADKGMRLFIVILGARSVDETYAAYSDLGGVGKPTFEAAVDFVNRRQGMADDHEMLVGCIETQAESYIEVDQSPAHIGPRPAVEGLLPPGIAIVSFASNDPAASAESRLGPVFTDDGAINGGKSSAVFRGVVGEFIELVG